MKPLSLDRRICDRVPVALTGVRIGNHCTIGRIHDISVTGVRIEDVDVVPPTHARIELIFVLSVEQAPFHAEGVVVRHTESGGFAVIFVAVEARVRYLVWTLSRCLQQLPDLAPAVGSGAFQGTNPAPEQPARKLERPNQRLSDRVPLTVIGIEVGALCGTGRIHDVSATGLRIEECAIAPDVGERARLTFVLSVEQPAFEAEGLVVRHTETGGFAVRWVAVQPRLRELVALLVARLQELPDLAPATKPEPDGPGDRAPKG
jgi:hypothetical protein